MSNVHTPQRRAVEALKSENMVPFIISEEDKEAQYYLQRKKDGEIKFQRIYLLGISEGVGTCSDLKDVNIAVFGRKKPSYIRFPKKTKEIICEWAALLREPSQQELKEEGKDSKSMPYLQVEEMRIYRIEEKCRLKRVYFCLTGKKKLYANTIC